MRRAIVAGASGLVGRSVVTQAASLYDEVIALVRASRGIAGERVIDFERLQPFEELAGADVFCCLGTTIKKAGSREAFRRVDHDYPLALARAAKERGARTFSIVTATGANKDSAVFYYRAKGEIEEDLRAAFPEGLILARPSMLLGARDEFRLGEEIGKALLGAFSFALAAKDKPIEASAVARALLRAASAGPRGVTVLEGASLHA